MKVKKICFYGPESTGKTSMAMRMAKIFETEFVPEVAREMIITNNFTLDQIVSIGKRQTERILEKEKTANKLLMCDTDLITTQIYSQYYLGVVPPELYLFERQIQFDLYLLFDIDVPWVADGLRDLPHKREEMFYIFRQALETRNIPCVLVQGDYNTRNNLVKEEIEKMLINYTRPAL
ncbi:MAG TPA: ATP-binding protein [Chryseosolibacter sp.]|nr:ATP-binding protein [Chryseosolibacter sp.]